MNVCSLIPILPFGNLIKDYFKKTILCLSVIIFFNFFGVLSAETIQTHVKYHSNSFFPATKGRARILLSQKWSKDINGVGKFELLTKYDPAYSYVPNGPARIIDGQNNSDLIILDSALCRIKIYNRFKNSYRIFKWHAHGVSKAPNLIDIAVNSSGNFLLLDKANGHVQKYDSQGNFINCFGDFSEALWLNVDSMDRVFVKDAGLPGILVFTNKGDWIGRVQTNLFQERISPVGDIYGIKMDIESSHSETPRYSLIRFSVFKNKTELNNRAIQTKLISVKGFNSDYELLGVQFIGLDSKGLSYLAVTEGKNGKPLVLSLVRYDSMGRIESRMEIEPVLNFNIDSSSIFVRNSGEILVFDQNPHTFVVKAYSLD